MVLVDTALWISEKYQFVDLRALTSDEVIVVCPAVVQELLQGASTKRMRDAVREVLAGISLIDSPTPLERFEHAARLYVACRALGYTITGYDCLIAASAIAHDALLLHADADFEFIADAAPELRQQRV